MSDEAGRLVTTGSFFKKRIEVGGHQSQQVAPVAAQREKRQM